MMIFSDQLPHAFTLSFFYSIFFKFKSFLRSKSAFTSQQNDGRQV